MSEKTKITCGTRNIDELEAHDYRERVLIKINDEVVFDVADGEPEDNSLGRDFSDCHSILSLLERVYEMGKNGEEVEFSDYEGLSF